VLGGSAKAQNSYRGDFLRLSGKTEKGRLSANTLVTTLPQFEAGLRYVFPMNGGFL
jgi:hypothetical protein